MGRCPHPTLAGILFSAIPAGIPFPVGPDGPVGTLSPSDFEYVGLVGPVGTLLLCDHVTELSPIVPVGELSSVNPVRTAPYGWWPLAVAGRFTELGVYS